MLRLKLPEEVVGEKAVLEEEGEAKEVKAVPLQGPLDPILEAAVESQPRVAGPKEASQEPTGPEPEPEEPPRGAPKKNPFGFLAALGAGALVLLGVALAGKGGASASGSGGTGANPTPTAPGGGSGSGPVIW
ncbi:MULTISPECIES: hypothetical protein [Thermus]|uniref:Uncharacterized protein n=1 Tax=Thermus thermophilus TaxID=274 RepID=A0A3P4ARM5_THETH|nr:MULTISPECIES: hypothetical protein [Thermus]VCU53792.1 hypothetical protein TTHN1_01578 [Thermus thermophilus]